MNYTRSTLCTLHLYSYQIIIVHSNINPPVKYLSNKTNNAKTKSVYVCKSRTTCAKVVSKVQKIFMTCKKVVNIRKAVSNVHKAASKIVQTDVSVSKNQINTSFQAMKNKIPHKMILVGPNTERYLHPKFWKTEWSSNCLCHWKTVTCKNIWFKRIQPMSIRPALSGKIEFWTIQKTF